jgi:membrane-bound lytic murein transglycosylase A
MVLSRAVTAAFAAVVLISGAGAMAIAASPPSAPPSRPNVPPAEPLEFAELRGWSEDDHLAAWTTWLASCRAKLRKARPLRESTAPPLLETVCRDALRSRVRTIDDARRFFETRFAPWRVGSGFFTGYYEPEVAGSLVATDRFRVPIYDRPDDLVTFKPGQAAPGLESLAAARRLPDGSLAAFPDRRAIEEGALEGRGLVRVFIEDPVDRFFLQVQGSGRVRLPDGRIVRLAYSGRNGHPYTPIGRIVADRLGVPRAEMTMPVLRAFLAKDANVAREVMHENRSFVFFRIATELDGASGPIGGEGIALTARRSLAVDRTLWPYGLPVFVSTEVPSDGGAREPFRRLMVAQDTGTAIVGEGRGDIFFGAGDGAGRQAGLMRASGDFIVLWPRARPEPTR